MPIRLLLPLSVACLALAWPGSSAAATQVAFLRPVEDVSLPFWCDWGYDWDERCYHDDTARLAIGGDVDKVWRSALRFSLAALPPGAGVQEARLGVWYDGTCVDRYGGHRPCDGRSWSVDAHAILDPDWVHEREVAFDPNAAARAALPAGAGPQWVVLDISDLVAAWASGEAANAGVLLKLSDAQEDFLGSGPSVPSSSFRATELRPWLEIAYVEPGVRASARMPASERVPPRPNHRSRAPARRRSRGEQGVLPRGARGARARAERRE
jgi:hypothetical protein